MTTQRRATVGAPTLRLAYLTGLLLLAIAIVGAGIGVGAQLVVRAEEPTAANGLIAFDAEGDIWLANADGSDVRRITADPAEERGPIWSRDGSRLAFMVDRGDGRTDLVTTDAEGGDRILVAASVAVPSLQHQSWSPDGLRLTYSAMVEGGRNNIFVAEADGSGPVQVGDPTLTAKEPAWSPDGRSIAFHGGTSSVEPTDPSGPAKRGVYVMDADGSNIRLVSQVVGSGGFAFSMPLWSPDGSRIVTYVGSENSHDIWVFDADGGEERNVSNSVGDDSWPTWAPDGERIAFDHFETRARVALVDAEGSQPFVLEDPRITNWEPVWSPDGTRFVVHLGPRHTRWSSRPPRPDRCHGRPYARERDAALTRSRAGRAQPARVLPSALTVSSDHSQRYVPGRTRYPSRVSGPHDAVPRPRCAASRWTIVSARGTRSSACVASSRSAARWCVAETCIGRPIVRRTPEPDTSRSSSQRTSDRPPASWGRMYGVKRSLTLDRQRPTSPARLRSG
jgi:TolB protein